MHSILILRGGAIGDFVLTGPVFDALRARWPRVRIELAGYPRIATLARRAGWADTFRSLDHRAAARLFSAPSDPCRAAPLDLGDWGVPLDTFDGVLSYLHDPDGIVGENLKRAGARHAVVHSPLPRQGHATDGLLAPLAAWGCVTTAGLAPRLILPTSDSPPLLPGLSVLARPCVALHPGSGGVAKRWPLDNFIDLARRVRDAWTPIFLFGEADEACRRAFMERAGSEFSAVDDLSLYDVALLVQSCCGYVGNDSGITHLAAALGVPTVALFGPSDPAVWGPRNPNARILAARPATTDGLARIAPELVERICRERF